MKHYGELDYISREPRNRPGWGATGAPGPVQVLSKNAYYVGRCYGPFDTKKQAEEASARLIADKRETDAREVKIRSLAKKARAKLTEEEYDAVFDLAISTDRGYF